MAAARHERLAINPDHVLGVLSHQAYVAAIRCVRLAEQLPGFHRCGLPNPPSGVAFRNIRTSETSSALIEALEGPAYTRNLTPAPCNHAAALLIRHAPARRCAAVHVRAAPRGVPRRAPAVRAVAGEDR